MKRTTDTRDKYVIRKPDKHRRIEKKHSPTTFDCFAEEFEVNARDLTNAQPDESGYIAGQVFMMWPRSEKLCKLQLKVSTGSLDVWFEGLGLEKLDFVSKDMLKISLKGVRKELKSSPHTLPFKLVFSNGALVKFLQSEKRDEEKLVDLFQAAEDEVRRTEEDWFLSSPPAKGPSESPRHGHVSFQEPQDVVVWLQNEEVTGPARDPDQLPANEFSTVLDTDYNAHEPKEPQSVDYVHHIGTTHAKRNYSSPANVGTVVDSTHSSSSSRIAIMSPIPGPSAIQPNQGKSGRIKKRDMRHPRDSAGSVTSSIVSGTDSAGPRTQNPSRIAKKLTKVQKKNKAAAQAKAAAQEAVNRPPSPDPALEMVPGFHSEKDGTYTPLENVVPGEKYNLVGVVVNVGPIRRTTTGDLSKSFTLADPSTNYGYESMTVNIFVPDTDEHLLPSVVVDQILLLRNIFCKEYKGKSQGTGYRNSFQWCGYNPIEGKHFYTVFSPNPTQTTFFKPSMAEMRYFVKLADWWRALKEAEQKTRNDDPSSSFTNHIVLPKPINPRKLQTISQFEPGTFVDCVVELLHIYLDGFTPDIRVTDYTENKHLQHSTEVYPLGRRMLKVSLWDAAKDMVEDLELHGLYLLKNMRLKKLEGDRIYLEGSAGYGDERAIYKLRSGSDQENLQDLLTRKVEYESNPQYSMFEVETVQAPVNDDVGEPMQQGHHIASESSADADQEISGILRCFHMDQRQSTIEEIKRNNQCPNKFRVRARIIEYYPRRIEDFVTAECNDCGKILDEGHHLCPECGDLSGKSTSVRYQFALRITDGSGEELNVSVTDDDAQELLFGLDVKDAREDAAALKRRLTPLIGHLETWHREFMEGTKTDDGNWVDLCLNSWVTETADGQSIRSYKLFGCKLRG